MVSCPLPLLLFPPAVLLERCWTRSHLVIDLALATNSLVPPPARPLSPTFRITSYRSPRKPSAIKHIIPCATGIAPADKEKGSFVIPATCPTSRDLNIKLRLLVQE